MSYCKRSIGSKQKKNGKATNWLVCTDLMNVAKKTGAILAFALTYGMYRTASVTTGTAYLVMVCIS